MTPKKHIKMIYDSLDYKKDSYLYLVEDKADYLIEKCAAVPVTKKMYDRYQWSQIKTNTNRLIYKPYGYLKAAKGSYSLSIVKHNSCWEQHQFHDICDLMEFQAFLLHKYKGQQLSFEMHWKLYD